MLFGLENASATYQRAITTIFHDMMHREIEGYVDDIAVKSKARENHFHVLRRVFERCRIYKLRMNPLKCAFGVSAGNFLGFLVHQRGIDVDPSKAQAIATMKPPTTVKELKSFLGEEGWDVADEVPGDLPEVSTIEAAGARWILKSYRSSTIAEGGAGIVLIKETGEAVAMSFKLDFTCTNNTAEYEAYLTGLAVALEMGIKSLRVIGDSNLVVCQAKGELTLKEPSLAPYRAMTQMLDDSFEDFDIQHSQRSNNCFANALATLRARISFEGTATDVTIIKKPVPTIQVLKEEFFGQPLDQADWRSPIKEALLSPSSKGQLKCFKYYTLVAGELYKKFPGGVLARCLSLNESSKRLREVPEKSCNSGGAISLYKRLQRSGYYWPDMDKQAANIQSQCEKCQHIPRHEESYAMFTSNDWRIPFLEYLIEDILPNNPNEAYRLKIMVNHYFVEGGVLFRKWFNGEPLRCLGTPKVQSVMQKAHADECGDHQGKKRLLQ
nr:uncharacterized protein LOC111990408 [Quercus suber]